MSYSGIWYKKFRNDNPVFGSFIEFRIDNYFLPHCLLRVNYLIHFGKEATPVPIIIPKLL